MDRTERHMETFRKLKQDPADWDLGSSGPEVTPKKGDCQLCGRHGLKKFYPLTNGNVTMYAGSECIKTWVETIYKTDYGVAFHTIMQEEWGKFKNLFFKEYDREYSSQPERNLAFRIYNEKGDDRDEVKQIYSLANKYEYTLPEKVKWLWELK